jgi:hypothetical protein
MDSGLNLIKNLIIIGLVGTAKIVLNSIKEEEPPLAAEVEIEKTDLSEILLSIRTEMNDHLMELPDDQKLLRNYVRGRLATLDEIENRLK